MSAERPRVIRKELEGGVREAMARMERRDEQLWTDVADNVPTVHALSSLVGVAAPSTSMRATSQFLVSGFPPPFPNRRGNGSNRSHSGISTTMLLTPCTDSGTWSRTAVGDATSSFVIRTNPGFSPSLLSL